jgi:hypothetical protein
VIAEPEQCPRPRVAPSLWVALILAAMLAVLWAGPVAAGATRAQQRSQAAPSPGAVKYYIVPSAGNGSAESLSLIAARTLGNGSRYLEIFNLNKGRRQPNGGRLENPAVIEPGWILELPPDAAGPAVHFGTLPPAGTPVARRVTHQSSRSTAAPAAASGWVEPAALLVAGLVIAGLAVATVRRRQGGGRRGRKHAGARMRPHRTGDGPGSSAAGELGTHATDVQAADLDWLDAIDAGAWRDWDAPPALHPDHPSAPQPRIGSPADQWSSDRPSSDRPSSDRRSDAVAGGNGRPQATLIDTQRADGYQATALGIRAEPQLRVAGLEATGLARTTPWDAVDLPRADSLWLAHRVLSEADQQAAEITLQAQGQAAAIRAAAQQEADKIKQRASDQAAALLAAAEWDAAHMRAAVMTMSVELGQVAAYVTENLTRSPAKPTATPEAQPAQPATARPRQYAAMRAVLAVVAALVLFAVTAAATELGLHGYPFFVFRSAGTGATPSGGLNEDQGPGQPHAPRAHINAPGPHRPQRSPKSPRAGGGNHG